MSQELKFIYFHKLNMFRAPLCPSSGVQDYCYIWCSAFAAVGDVVISRVTGRVHYLKVVAQWCPKHVDFMKVNKLQLL
jgi:hypothetical protein